MADDLKGQGWVPLPQVPLPDPTVPGTGAPSVECPSCHGEGGGIANLAGDEHACGTCHGTGRVITDGAPEVEARLAKVEQRFRLTPGHMLSQDRIDGRWLCDALRAALTELAAARQENGAWWLIEKPEPGGVYWWAGGTERRYPDLPLNGWPQQFWEDANKAVRFRSRQDAESVLRLMPSDWQEIMIVTEHRWLASPSEERPKIVCLCGSTRFYKEFQVANYEETMAGRIVLSVGFYPHSAEHHETVGLTNAGYPTSKKAELDELHLRKIDLADEILVLNVGGYIGDSTRREIVYATAHGKPVRYLESLIEDAAGAEPEREGR